MIHKRNLEWNDHTLNIHVNIHAAWANSKLTILSGTGSCKLDICPFSQSTLRRPYIVSIWVPLFLDCATFFEKKDFFQMVNHAPIGAKAKNAQERKGIGRASRERGKLRGRSIVLQQNSWALSSTSTAPRFTYPPSSRLHKLEPTTDSYAIVLQRSR